MFPFLEAPRLAVGATKAPSQCVPGATFLPFSGVKMDLNLMLMIGVMSPFPHMASWRAVIKSPSLISACSFGNKKVLKRHEFGSHYYIYN